MIRDVHQHWLLDCDFREVCLKDFIPDTSDEYADVPNYSFGPWLFDFCRKIITRSMKVDELDTQQTSKEKWDSFVSMIVEKEIAELVILIERPTSNAIVDSYRECTLQAYVFRLKKAGIECKVVYSPGTT